MISIRHAAAADMAAVTAVANALIDATTIVWTDIHDTVEQRHHWFEAQVVARRPVLVAVDTSVGTAEIVGFASYGDFRDSTKWPGYRHVVEHTVHVREDHWGTGIGRQLMVELIARARDDAKTEIIGAIDGTNESSIRFHQRLGFVEVGRLPRIGWKFDRWLDLVLMQRGTEPPTP